MPGRDIMWRALAGAAVALVLLVSVVWGQQGSLAPGDEKSGTTRVLEAGARMLQRNSPLAAMDIHLDGFHLLKDEPQHQMEAHHYCRQVNEDFAQCVLFDGSDRTANLNGIEYIISERLFDQLPSQERGYWHPHNGEILSGQLIAPGIPGVAEKALMRKKMNSYGKTWHLWNTGSMGQGADRLPFGPPRLAWSFNRDDELRPELLAQRDQRLHVSTEAKRRERAGLATLARPQSGVDDLHAAFPQGRDIPGVVDRKAAATSRIPGAGASR